MKVLYPGDLVATNAPYPTGCHTSLVLRSGMWTGSLKYVAVDTPGVLVSIRSDDEWEYSGVYVVWPDFIGWCVDTEVRHV